MLAPIFVYTPPFHALLGTASLTADELLFVLPFPFIVWGADELRRWYVLRRRASVVSHGGSRAVPRWRRRAAGVASMPWRLPRRS